LSRGRTGRDFGRTFMTRNGGKTGEIPAKGKKANPGRQRRKKSVRVYYLEEPLKVSARRGRSRSPEGGSRKGSSLIVGGRSKYECRTEKPIKTDSAIKKPSSMGKDGDQ